LPRGRQLVGLPHRWWQGTFRWEARGDPLVSEKKPALIYFPAARKFCPVCGKVSYSVSGEHPQCAVARGDAAFRAKQKKRSERKQALVLYKPLAASARR
jgi:hypothetical protein